MILLLLRDLSHNIINPKFFIVQLKSLENLMSPVQFNALMLWRGRGDCAFRERRRITDSAAFPEMTSDLGHGNWSLTGLDQLNTLTRTIFDILLLKLNSEFNGNPLIPLKFGQGESYNSKIACSMSSTQASNLFSVNGIVAVITGGGTGKCNLVCAQTFLTQLKALDR